MYVCKYSQMNGIFHYSYSSAFWTPTERKSVGKKPKIIEYEKIFTNNNKARLRNFTQTVTTKSLLSKIYIQYLCNEDARYRMYCTYVNSRPCCWL